MVMVLRASGKKNAVGGPLDQQQEVLSSRVSTAVVTFLRLLFGLKFLYIKNRKEHWITVLTLENCDLALLQQCAAAASSAFVRPLDIYNLLRILVHI